MSTEILKDFLIAVGFKIDESSYKRASNAIAQVEKALKENEKADQGRADAEQKRMEQRRRNGQALSLFLGDFAKVAAGAGAVVGGAMIAMAESIRRGIGEFDRLAYISGRTGASVNNLKALGYAFSQTGSSAEAAISAVENFARARRTNPGIDAMLRGYGVKTTGDTSEMLMSSIDAINARHPQWSGAQVADQLGISPDEYDHLVRYRKELAQFEQQYKGLQRSFGVNGGEMARSSTAISRSLGEMSAVVEVLKQKLISLFLPAVEAVTVALAGMLKDLTSEENIKAISDYFEKPTLAIKEMVRWVKYLYGEFVRLFDYVRNSPFGKIIGAINPGYFREKLLDAIVPGAQAATNPEGDTTAGADKPGLFKRGLNAIKRGLGIGGEDMTPTKGDRTSIAGRTFGAKAPGVMKRLMADFGLSKDEAAIVLGNLGHESAGFTAFEEGGGGPGRGWAQWTDPGRKRRFYKYAKDNNLDIKSDEANYGFLKWELENTHASSISALKRAKSYDQKMIKFQESFETAGIPAYGSRYKYAERAREAYDRAEASRSAPVSIQPRLASPPNMSPGGFDVNALTRTAPMGAYSATTDNSRRSDVKFGDTNVTITGNGDPHATAASFKRAQADLDSMRMRDVQTAVR